MMGPGGAGSFDDAWERRVTEVVQGVAVQFVNSEDLIKLKTAAGRAIDKRDLRSLAQADRASRAVKPRSATRKPRKTGRK
jgi:predicted nucleotidyltransferase